MSLNYGGRAVQRDVAARPFLSPLPISPGQTLEGKASSLRSLVMLLGLPLLPLLFSAPSGSWPTLLWRFGAVEAGLYLLCETAPAVAFLTSGLGSANATAVGNPTSFATLLVLLPALRAALAESFGAALLSLLSLAALAFEARRAASHSLRWLDDANSALERDTPVWRALLVFAAFIAIQGFSAQILGLGEKAGASEWALPGTYLLSAVALLLLTLVRRRGLPPVTLLPRKLWLLPLGLAAGLASGGLALGYLHLVHWLGVELPDADLMNQSSPLGLALAVVVAAPLAEETFFRGWLQQAIGVELPGHLKRWALVLAAVTFALVHPAISFVPVCILGLAAGLLYELGGALLPGMLAHAAHNAIALWFGQ